MAAGAGIRARRPAPASWKMLPWERPYDVQETAPPLPTGDSPRSPSLARVQLGKPPRMAVTMAAQGGGWGTLGPATQVAAAGEARNAVSVAAVAAVAALTRPAAARKAVTQPPHNSQQQPTPAVPPPSTRGPRWWENTPPHPPPRRRHSDTGKRGPATTMAWRTPQRPPAARDGDPAGRAAPPPTATAAAAAATGQWRQKQAADAGARQWVRLRGTAPRKGTPPAECLGTPPAGGPTVASTAASASGTLAATTEAVVACGGPKRGA